MNRNRVKTKVQQEIRLHLSTRCLMTSGISDAVLHSPRHSHVSVAEEDGKVPTQPGCFSSSVHGCVFSRPSAFPRTKRSSLQQRDEGSDDNRHRNIWLSDLRQMLDLEIESSNTELTSSGRAGGVQAQLEIVRAQWGKSEHLYSVLYHHHTDTS